MRNALIACLAVILAGEWGWLPTSGYLDMTADPVQFLIGLAIITGSVLVFTIVWIIAWANLSGEVGQ
ncbi:hypothetical protein [Aureimonas altamirensis]|uniref:hypothetical protein n=1 Tax=Aureimonas altamirensis TaxID=370622 RepID=UPI0025537A1D|nr:hypothetical protein [Aureimonas altamirensis]